MAHAGDNRYLRAAGLCSAEPGNAGSLYCG